MKVSVLCSFFGFSKRANMLAAIIVAVVLLAGGTVVLMKTVQREESKVDEQQRLVNEADSTMRQAIALGISEWMRGGFSNKNKVWYSNYPLPADFKEAKESQKAIVNQKASSYMDRLRHENEKYYISPEVKVEFIIGESLTEEDLKTIKAKVTEFKVGLKTENSQQVQDISTIYTFPYKAWLMYDTMYKWELENADQLTQHIRDDAFLKNPCQLVTGGCDCETLRFSEAAKENLKLTQQDIVDVLNERVAALERKFEGTGIKCSYEIRIMDIQNVENVAWTVGDVGPNGTQIVDIREGNTGYIYETKNWEERKTLPSPGAPNGGIPMTEGAQQLEGVTYRPSLGVDNGIINTYSESSVVNRGCEGSMSDIGLPTQNLAQSMKIGMLAMDKKAAALLTIKCVDPTKSIEGLQGLEPLTAEIDIRFALALDCPLPNRALDIYGGDNLATCPGGSCFPAGTMITMADGTKKPIELVKVGDLVLSYNTYTGESSSGTVLELESPVREGLYVLYLDDGTSIRVTNEHPFYVKKKSGEIGWASILPSETYKETKSIDSVLQLQVGDKLFKQDGTWPTVTSIDYIPGDVRTYNLKEVSGHDNFFAEDALVHNKCCFAEGTPVTMADGTTKNIEDVHIGDLIMSYNLETSKPEPAVVLELQRPKREGIYTIIFENEKVLKATNDHPLFARTNSGVGWAAIEPDAALSGYALKKVYKLDVGSEVLQQDGTFATIKSIEYVPGEVQTYTLKKVSKNMNFFANGFLAHNQKLIGYVGLACPIQCQPCYGCQPKAGITNPRQGVPEDWECVGPLPDLVCGKCGICDAQGQCTIPQVAGYPCFEQDNDGKFTGDNRYLGNCEGCDGIHTGDEGCVINPPGIENLIDKPCGPNNPCTKCDGSGRAPPLGCVAFDQDATCNDERISEEDRRCMICAANTPGQCVADTSRDGRICNDCATCSGGRCGAPAPDVVGNCNTTAKPCMKCSSTLANACEVDLSKRGVCPACKTCGIDGSCVADPLAAGKSCGSCRQCDGNGNCVPAYEGEQCNSRDGCVWTCHNGLCVLANEGASCTASSNTCGLQQKCTTKGCETVSSEKDFICCGTAKCPSGSACCELYNQCTACPVPN